MKRIFLISIMLIISACTFDSTTPDDPPVEEQLPSAPVVDYDMWGSPKLSWNCTNNTYKVYLTDQVLLTKTELVPNPLARFVIAGGLVVNRTYKWYVEVKDKAGNILAGPTWEFKFLPQPLKEGGSLFTNYTLFEKLPHNVMSYFQVTTFGGNGVTGLINSDFHVTDDGEDLPINESKAVINNYHPDYFKHKVMVIIDVSTSETGQGLADIKKVAENFINSFMDGAAQKEVALYKFSSGLQKVLDFTNDANLVKTELNKLNVEFATTNLYGTVVNISKEMQDKITYNHVEKFTALVFTDGTETQDSYTLGQALDASLNKLFYTIGIGLQVDDYILEKIGRAGYVKVVNNNQDDLNYKMKVLSDHLTGFYNSFYNLKYDTPKRGDKSHTLLISLKNNSFNGAGSILRQTYNSGSFFDITPGVYINSNKSNPQGISEIYIPLSDSKTVEVFSFLLENEPFYIVGIDPAMVGKIVVTETEKNKFKIETRQFKVVTNIVFSDMNNPGNQRVLNVKVGM